MLYPIVSIMLFFCASLGGHDQLESAKAHIVNQDELEGYVLYSKALDSVDQNRSARLPWSLSEPEKIVFDDLYVVYLQELGQGNLFHDKVHSACLDHPEWKSLLFFKAALMANRGDTILFFDTFWHAYASYSNLPIAYKIRGSIAHKIYEMASEPDLRETARKQSLDFFIQAFSRSPEDLSLINRIILLSRPEDQKVVLSQLVPVLSSVANPPSRTQCFMLLEIVQQLGSKADLEQMHTLARRWFPTSRFLDEWEKINGFQKEAVSTYDASS